MRSTVQPYKRGDRHRDQKHDQQDHGHNGEPDRDQDQERDQRDKAADHEDIAMGEIDHADDAIDHRVADGDQAIDRAEYNAVDQLLGEIVHVLPCPKIWHRRGDGPGSRNIASVTFSNSGGSRGVRQQREMQPQALYKASSRDSVAQRIPIRTGPRAVSRCRPAAWATVRTFAAGSDPLFRAVDIAKSRRRSQRCDGRVRDAAIKVNKGFKLPVAV